ncbi:MAG: heterodisulfide reductase-related iron-sulfur binding cluster [Desulfobacterales bacterium]
MRKRVESFEPEKKIREVVDACTDCDVCSHLMDADCLFFPELYRLWDQEQASGEAISADALRRLVDLCNFCVLCPCPNIRADVIEAKTQFIERDGLKFGVRTIEDVERIGKICGTLPRLFNALLRNRPTGNLLKSATGIHAERKFPEFPPTNFIRWAQKRRLNIKRNPANKRKVAYFAGCTARFLFPEVPRAAVSLLQAVGIDVYVPEQKCCGMPSLLEGDRKLTLEFVGSNLRQLTDAVKDGYGIVCSCPTCGFMLKTILKEGAYYSAEYQASVGSEASRLKVPAGKDLLDGRKENGFVVLQKSIYGSILKDEGYFSNFSARDRIRVAEHTFDLGEYLKRLQCAGELDPPANTVTGRMLYFPPCHGREQKIGRPYMEQLGRIPGIQLESIDGHFYCCGMAGIMGFKREFHEPSIQLGRRLMDKIREIDPDRIVTDCLSCRLQFNQLLPHPVSHPIEILRDAYLKK